MYRTPRKKKEPGKRFHHASNLAFAHSCRCELRASSRRARAGARRFRRRRRGRRVRVRGRHGLHAHTSGAPGAPGSVGDGGAAVSFPARTKKNTRVDPRPRPPERRRRGRPRPPRRARPRAPRGRPPRGGGRARRRVRRSISAEHLGRAREVVNVNGLCSMIIAASSARQTRVVSSAATPLQGSSCKHKVQRVARATARSRAAPGSPPGAVVVFGGRGLASARPPPPANEASDVRGSPPARIALVIPGSAREPPRSSSASALPAAYACRARARARARGRDVRRVHQRAAPWTGRASPSSFAGPRSRAGLGAVTILQQREVRRVDGRGGRAARGTPPRPPVRA